MKSIIYFAFAFMLLMSCKKIENYIQNETELSNSKIPVNNIAYKAVAALYVNKFDTINGFAYKEDTLLNWSKRNGFRQLYLYGISSNITSPKFSAKLNAFIGKAHGSPYFMKISIVAASESSAWNVYSSYYTSSSYINKYDAINTEFEFWNDPPVTNSFSNYLPLLDTINYINSITTSPKVGRNLYVGRFEDADSARGVIPYFTKDSLLTHLINKNDKILITNYHTNAGTTLSSILVQKLNELSIKAHTMNKIVNVEILYNVRLGSPSPNIYSYCVSNTFASAFSNFTTNYNASTGISYKSNLRIVGYSFYRYTDARSARPI